MLKAVAPKLHFRRLELKYELPSGLADLLVPTLLKYAQVDPYAQAKGWYQVHSYYWDSPTLNSYYAQEAGLLFRKKYRLRTYDHERDVFLEIKRKIKDTVVKDRVPVKPKQWQQPRIISTFDGAVSDPVISEFKNDYHQLRLVPQTYVRYRRRPFITSRRAQLRITLDDQLEIATWNRDGTISKFTTIQPNNTVLEIKATGLLPAWLSDIIKQYQLTRIPYSKYSKSVQQLGLC